MLATSGRAKTEAQEFIEASRIFLKDDFLPKLKHCLENLTEQDLWWRPNEQSNSVGNLILHLCGNMSQWILNPMGGRRFDRCRLTVSFQARIGDGNRRQQCPRVAMQRIGEQFAGRGKFHDTSTVEHRHPMAEVANHAQIVGYE